MTDRELVGNRQHPSIQADLDLPASSRSGGREPNSQQDLYGLKSHAEVVGSPRLREESTWRVDLDCAPSVPATQGPGGRSSGRPRKGAAVLTESAEMWSGRLRVPYVRPSVEEAGHPPDGSLREHGISGLLCPLAPCAFPWVPCEAESQGEHNGRSLRSSRHALQTSQLDRCWSRDWSVWLRQRDACEGIRMRGLVFGRCSMGRGGFEHGHHRDGGLVVSPRRMSGGHRGFVSWR